MCPTSKIIGIKKKKQKYVLNKEYIGGSNVKEQV